MPWGQLVPHQLGDIYTVYRKPWRKIFQSQLWFTQLLLKSSFKKVNFHKLSWQQLSLLLIYQSISKNSQRLSKFHCHWALQVLPFSGTEDVSCWNLQSLWAIQNQVSEKEGGKIPFLGVMNQKNKKVFWVLFFILNISSVSSIGYAVSGEKGKVRHLPSIVKKVN